MTMRFKVDEYLPGEIALMLRADGVQPERLKENSRGQRPRSRAPRFFLDPERQRRELSRDVWEVFHGLLTFVGSSLTDGWRL